MNKKEFCAVLLLVFNGLACTKRKEPEIPEGKNKSAASQSNLLSPEMGQKDVEISQVVASPPINAKDLIVEQFDVTAYPIHSFVAAKVQLKLDERADYCKIDACLSDNKEYCQKYTINTSEEIIYSFPEGNLILKASCCVEKERAIDEKTCGSEQTVRYLQSANSDSQLKELLEKKEEINQQILQRITEGKEIAKKYQNSLNLTEQDQNATTKDKIINNFLNINPHVLATVVKSEVFDEILHEVRNINADNPSLNLASSSDECKENEENNDNKSTSSELFKMQQCSKGSLGIAIGLIATGGVALIGGVGLAIASGKLAPKVFPHRAAAMRRNKKVGSGKTPLIAAGVGIAAVGLGILVGGIIAAISSNEYNLTSSEVELNFEKVEQDLIKLKFESNRIDSMIEQRIEEN